ncbi:MAG: hypothetical protein MJE66_22280 [Proteobacteria bacterium]|nr:hypothetical protein [Pseudomonadota bacterium]
MTSFPYRVFDPLLPESAAREIVALCERFGSYGMYSEEGLNEGIGEGLPQRFDAAFNFVRTGGRFGRREDLKTLAARTNYFRETYAYGEEIAAPGIEPFFHHEGFVEAAREIHGRPVVEPAIVYANLLLPGQELAVHTDVPEFRGANRKLHPQWLLVVMHHSGLFDRWRMPIATGVSWFHDARGGEFAFYPEGAERPPVAHNVRFNTAIAVDTDSVFHGVDRVREDGVKSLPDLRPGMRLESEGGGRWFVREGSQRIADYRWEEMRFSVSWKAYCFEDEAERRHWREHSDDLGLETVLGTLESDLRRRGRLTGVRPDNRAFAELLVAEYVRFPPPVETS